MSKRQPGVTSGAMTDADWAQLCEVTAHKILRKGFVIEHISPMTSIQLGAELSTGVVLIVSTGNKTVRDVKSTEAGVAEGLMDIAAEGLKGTMILYGLAFYFAAAG